MKSPRGPLDPELEALLENGRIIQRVPDVVRARALARARAAIATSAAVAPTPAASWHGRGLRMAVAACVALALGAAGAVAALNGRLPWARESTSSVPPAAPRAAVPARDATRELQPVPELAPEPIAIPKPQRPARSANAQESYAAELALLQRAHAAYAARDFTGTLMLAAEHAHRFPNGRLSEEREGLRVESLAGSGRRDETRRAVAAFARRFPRSVLLPRLREMANRAE